MAVPRINVPTGFNSLDQNVYGNDGLPMNSFLGKQLQQNDLAALQYLRRSVAESFPVIDPVEIASYTGRDSGIYPVYITSQLKEIEWYIIATVTGEKVSVTPYEIGSRRREAFAVDESNSFAMSTSATPTLYGPFAQLVKPGSTNVGLIFKSFLDIGTPTTSGPIYTYINNNVRAVNDAAFSGVLAGAAPAYALSIYDTVTSERITDWYDIVDIASSPYEDPTSGVARVNDVAIVNSTIPEGATTVVTNKNYEVQPLTSCLLYAISMHEKPLTGNLATQV